MPSPVAALPVPWHKRLFDLIVVIPLLVILLPVFLFVAAAVLADLGWPVIFTQERAGYAGRVFHIYKFRSMKHPRRHNGLALTDEQRLTSLGRFLRSSSLDELPELFNILTGDMSLVGPRPLYAHYLTRYTSEQNRRHSVLPGITGWAQVNGRNAISWDEKFRLDLWYVDHWSLGLDIKILALTAWKVLRREGISPPGQETMEEFTGHDPRG